MALSVSPYGLPAPPLGEPRGPVRIRLGAFQLVFFAPQTPPPRYARPTSPFRGGFYYSSTSPARLRAKRDLISSGAYPWPMAHMSLVMAASLVMSRP